MSCSAGKAGVISEVRDTFQLDSDPSHGYYQESKLIVQKGKKAQGPAHLIHCLTSPPVLILPTWVREVNFHPDASELGAGRLAPNLPREPNGS